ncbi:MAG TPA: type I methionyl aminopeptidase [Patescibacteria group bacterium]|nr:type I methionyl aminopeptidase [Patescibacteria group bacterium]
MSLIKTPAEIASLHEGGEILSRILRELRSLCVAGAKTDELDAIARRRMAEAHARPSFLGYRMGRGPAFPGAVCISVNEEVVHGLPMPRRTIKNGDVVGLDIGLWYKDLATDMATTVIVGKVGTKEQNLVSDTRQSLLEGLRAVRAGHYVSDISAAIEDYLKPMSYGIVKDLVGHGVGHATHEEPQIPNYREPNAPDVLLKKGMVLAIEPMVTLGTWRVKGLSDGWTIVTADGSLSAHFEVTIAVTESGYDLITPWPDV